MINKLISIYITDYAKINRYIVTSFISYFLTIVLLYSLLLSFSESSSIIITQSIKIIFIFILVKYYTFQDYKFAKEQFVLYFLLVLLFKFLEAILIYSFTYIHISIEINVLTVLIISSVFKYFIFKNIFR